MNLIGGRQRILQPSFHIQKKKRSGLQRKRESDEVIKLI